MVTITNGVPDAATQQEIYESLEAALLAEGDYDTSDGSTFDSILLALSQVLADEQEPGLVDVYNSAFLDRAEGQNLENVVSVLGLARQSAVHATGTVTFDHEDEVDSTVSISNGTTVETPSGTAFDTTEAVDIPYFDGFEGGSPLSNYSGDTGSFEQSTAQAFEGSNSLHATSGGNVWRDGVTSSRGMTHHAYLYLDSADGGAQIGTFRYIGESGNLSAGYDVIVDADGNDVTLSPGGPTKSVTVPSDVWIHIEATAGLDGTHTATLTNTSTSSEITTITMTEPSYPQVGDDHDGIVGLGANSSAVYWDEIAASDVVADIRAVDGGTGGNVGSNAISVLSSGISGVNNVFNSQATGDTSLFDTDAESLVAGTPEESDEDLRERARRVSGDGGAATIDALLGSVLDVDNVTSVRAFENDTDTDNTGTGGLPPVSFELVVNGGDDSAVAEAIFDEKAATARDYGGANGTDTTASVDAVNDQSFTIHFSRPTVVNVDPTLDIVVNDEYAGDEEVKRAVSEYIGGTGVDGASVQGLDAGEDVVINELEARIHGVEGVVGVDSSDSSYTPTTTTDANGLEVVSVGDNEVAETDATDGSISITTTEI